jgi:hypothetical protein
MLGDAQRGLRYIIIFVYIIIGDINDASAETEINDGIEHISGDVMTRNLWN